MPKKSPRIIMLGICIAMKIKALNRTILLFSRPKNSEVIMRLTDLGITAILRIWIRSMASEYLGKNSAKTMGDKNIPTSVKTTEPIITKIFNFLFGVLHKK